jgi:hypothetical protein
MKKLLTLAFYLLPVISVFSQNVPSDIILSYQDEIALWLKDNDIQAMNLFHKESQTLQFNGINLFSKPYIHEKSPAPKIFGKGGSVIECFSTGKFLTISESEKISEMAFSCIPIDAKRAFLPFRTFDSFKNVLIFNPGILFASNGGLNKDFNGDFAYLIFYFGPANERYPDTVFDIQFKQLSSGNAMDFFITPYSWYYALFRINKANEIDLVSFYGIN